MEGQECAWCGAQADLQRHHIDPTQKEDHRIWSWSKERREKELAKCIVLCRSCHYRCHYAMRNPLSERERNILLQNLQLMPC